MVRAEAFWCATLVVGLAFAGCVGEGGEAKANLLAKKRASAGGAESVANEVTYWLTDATGALAAAPDTLAAELAQPIKTALSYTGKRGGEPLVGVNKAGAIFVVAGLSTMRSTDHGVTWTEVYNHGRDAPPGVNTSSDVMLWVDPVTDRVFTDHMLSLACSDMAFSDDGGTTWIQRPLDCGIPVNDHQKWASAPWHAPVPTPPAPLPRSVVYYCYNKLVASFCAVSYNGGLLFQHDQPAVREPCSGGINGHPAWAPDGTVYLPRTYGCNRPVVGVTENNGLTWTTRVGPDIHGGVEIDPDITVTPDGTAYMIYRGVDQQEYLVRSTDKFVTWQGPWKVNPPHVRTTVFSAITSVDNGRIAMAYLGTEENITWEKNPKGDPSFAPNGTKWNMYVTYSLDAAAPQPFFATSQANPADDPMQRGCIWLTGGGNPCRNMLDFIDMASDGEGRIFVAVTDGCTFNHPNGQCAKDPTALDTTSRSRDNAVVVALNAPSLKASNPRVLTELSTPR